MFPFLGWFELLFGGLLLVLLVGPPILYLAGPWRDRRDEILGSLTGRSVKLYFDSFFPSGMQELRGRGRPETAGGPAAILARLYHRQFGRRRFIVPVLALVAVGLAGLLWTGYSIGVAVGVRPSAPGVLPWLAVAAVAGAYVWVVDDLVRRWRTRDYSPADLWNAALRLVLAVPLGFSVGALLQPELGAPVAFLLGVFPTTTVSIVVRRLLERKAGIGDVGAAKQSELEKLQGVSPAIAERFADEGVATIVQLAYADPVELTMRCSSLTFSFVVDCASQALAWLYLEDKLALLRPFSLRGAQEISNLVDDLGKEGDEPVAASVTLARCAVATALPVEGLERSFREIAGDPYTQFICSVWGIGPDEEEAEPAGDLADEAPQG